VSQFNPGSREARKKDKTINGQTEEHQNRRGDKLTRAHVLANEILARGQFPMPEYELRPSDDSPSPGRNSRPANIQRRAKPPSTSQASAGYATQKLRLSSHLRPNAALEPRSIAPAIASDLGTPACCIMTRAMPQCRRTKPRKKIDAIGVDFPKEEARQMFFGGQDIGRKPGACGIPKVTPAVMYSPESPTEDGRRSGI